MELGLRQGVSCRDQYCLISMLRPTLEEPTRCAQVLGPYCVVCVTVVEDKSMCMYGMSGPTLGAILVVNKWLSDGVAQEVLLASLCMHHHGACDGGGRILWRLLSWCRVFSMWFLPMAIHL